MPKSNDPEQTRAIKAVALYNDLLFSGRKLTLSDIHEKYGWPKQSILRVVDSIDQAVGGVQSGKDEKGRRWFQLPAPSARPRASLTADTIRNLRACGDMVAHLLPEEMRKNFETAISKTTVLLGDGEGRDMATAVTSRAIAKGYVDYSAFGGVIETLSESIPAKKVCKVAYTKPDGKNSQELVVAPLRLVAYHDALYLRCRYVWLDGKPKPDFGVRMLAVHRMKSVVKTDQSTSVEDAEGPETFGFMKQDEIMVKVRFADWTAQYVKERIWSADQRIVDHDDGNIVIEFTASSRSEMAAGALGFAPHAELLAPEDLRREIQLKAAQTSLLHNN